MSDPVRTKFGPLLSQISRHWRRAMNRRLQPYGLTEATWLPLLHLSRAEHPMRQKDLAASIGLDGSSVVRLLDALEAAGLLRRTEGDGDRRAKVLVLTAQGQSIVGQVERVSQQVRDDVMRDIPADELADAFHVLQRLHGAFEADAGSTPR